MCYVITVSIQNILKISNYQSFKGSYLYSQVHWEKHLQLKILLSPILSQEGFLQNPCKMQNHTAVFWPILSGEGKGCPYFWFNLAESQDLKNER